MRVEMYVEMESLTLSYQQFLDSLVVRISACHVEGPGSIPGRGETFFHIFKLERFLWKRFFLGKFNPNELIELEMRDCWKL